MWLVLFMLLWLPQAKDDCPLSIEKFEFRFQTIGTVDDRARFSVKLKNNSTKLVKEVEWGYLLIDSLRGNTVIDKIYFKTGDKPLKPAQSRDYTKRVDGYVFPDYVHGKPVVTKVVFDDGTIWQAATPQG